jgi:uncharacterized protein YpiB (UPF0302 family)
VSGVKVIENSHQKQLITVMLHEINLEHKKKQLEEKIDVALDTRDETLFKKLSKELLLLISEVETQTPKIP